MSFAKTANSPSRSSKYNYRPSDRESVAFVMNGFPVRRLTNHSKAECTGCLLLAKKTGLSELYLNKNFLLWSDDDGWVTAYKAEKEKYFQAVLTNKKLDELDQERTIKETSTAPKRKILKNLNFTESETNTKHRIMDGFYLVYYC